MTNESISNYSVRRLILVGDPPLYFDHELTAPIGYKLPADSILELCEIQGKSVKVLLPDRNTAYIDSQTDCIFLKKCWVNTNEIEVYRQPVEASELVGILKPGIQFNLLYRVNENKSWAKIELSSGDFGYIKADSKCITEDNLIKTIGQMVNQNVSETNIVKEFTNKDIPEDCIRFYYQKVIETIGNKNTFVDTQEAKKYKRLMVFGLLWAVGGAAVTAVSYNVASPGSMYFVFWGAIIFGIINFFKGLYGWMRSRRNDNVY